MKETKPKKEKKIDPYSFEGIPGLGPVKIEALKQEGFYNTLQVIHKTPTWLKDVTGCDRDEAGEIFGLMKKRLRDAKVILPQEMTGTELLAERLKVERIGTGCNAIDHLLNGGIECRCITEVYGENGSGKTQFSHTLTIQVQRKKEDGGLAEEGKPPPMVLYIDTENTMRPERIISILKGKGMIKEDKEAEKYLDHIIIRKATDAVQQINYIKDAIEMVQHVPIRLIILDSGTSLFRSDYLGRGNTKSKFDLMNEMVHDLRAIAENNNIAILFVNQIYHKPDEMYGADPDIPYGGNIIGHAMPYRLKTMKSGSKHKLRIKKSPYQDNNDCVFEITEAGVVDPTATVKR